MSARAKRWLAGCGLAIGASVVALLLFDWNWLTGPLERRVQARTGRALAIEQLHVDLLPLRLRVRGLRFDNPPWAAEPQMLTLEEADIRLRLTPLLRGRLVFPEIRLVKPRLHLERSEAHGNNWTFTDKDPAAGETPGQQGAPEIGRLMVDEGRLTLRDPQQGTDLRLAVQTLDGAQPRLRLDAQGRYRDLPVQAEATGDPVLALAATGSPYALEARFVIGPTSGTASGSVTGLAAFAAADLTLEVRGKSLAELYRVIPLSLPDTPPYHVRGRLRRETGLWRFHDFAGTVGDSDLAGDADIHTADGRVRLEATLVSKLLDFNDLGSLVGVPPGTGAGETASPEQRRAAQAAAARPTVLPQQEFKSERLRAMDAAVRFSGQRIRGTRLPLDDVKMELELQDGVLKLRPLDFGAARGNVVAALTLDARNDPATLDGDFEFRRIRLSEMFPRSDVIQRSTGLIGGRATLRGTGNSAAALLASSDGTLGLAMTGGEVSALLLEAVGLDAAEVLRFLFGGDKAVPVRCAVADAEIRDGVVQARNVLVDTTDTNIKVEGSINLGDESLHLTLHPLPKDYSPLSLRSPLHVKGSFKDPELELDDELLLRGGVAAALAAIAAPLTALLPLVEAGPGKDANCEPLAAAVKRHAGAPPGG